MNAKRNNPIPGILTILILLLMISFPLVSAIKGQIQWEEKCKITKKMNGIVTEVEYLTGNSFLDIPKTIVRFEDGRIKAFNGISDAVFKKDDFNIITYNAGKDIIISVKTTRDN